MELWFGEGWWEVVLQDASDASGDVDKTKQMYAVHSEVRYLSRLQCMHELWSRAHATMHGRVLDDGLELVVQHLGGMSRIN